MERRSGQLQVAEGDTADRKVTAKATIDLASGFATGGTLPGERAAVFCEFSGDYEMEERAAHFHVGPEVPAQSEASDRRDLMEAVQLNATGPTPPQLVAKMAAARAAMQKSNLGLTEVPIGRAERAVGSCRRGIAASKGPGESFRSAYEGVPLAQQGVDPAMKRRLCLPRRRPCRKAPSPTRLSHLSIQSKNSSGSEKAVDS